MENTAGQKSGANRLSQRKKKTRPKSEEEVNSAEKTQNRPGKRGIREKVRSSKRGGSTAMEILGERRTMQDYS